MHILFYVVAFIVSLNSTTYATSQQKLLYNNASYNNTFKKLPSDFKPSIKPWTIIIYMAADNDLRSFAYKNLEQIKFLLRSTAATDNFHIFIHLDVHNPGQKKSTFHLMGHEKELCLIEEMAAMDSGREETLVLTYAESVKYCPSEKVILGLWNHGTGSLSPLSGKVINPSSFYKYDPIQHKIVLNRSFEFLEYIEKLELSDDRAICFDDSTHNYLSNEKLGQALNTICTHYRDGKKIDLIFCDACLMSSIEFIYEILPWTDYFIASEEVILANGFRYDQVFNYFNDPHATLPEFLTYCVKVFENTYQKLTPDYTLSSIQLKQVATMYGSINNISELLISALAQQKNGSVKDFIKLSSSKPQCTCFHEPTYKDIKHLFTNFLTNISMIKLSSPEAEHSIKQRLATELSSALRILDESVVAHVAGKNLQKSGGISIYLPSQRLHPSFESTSFAQASLWYALIKIYLAA